MRLLAVLFLSIGLSAQVTPNLDLNIPTTGTTMWGGLLNNNFLLLDGYLTGGMRLPGTLEVTNIDMSGSMSQTGNFGVTGNLSVNGITTLNGPFNLPAQSSKTVFGNCGNTLAVPGFCGIASILPFTFSGPASVVSTVGTFSGGAGALVCKDASGNITTTGCSTAGGGAIVGSPAGGVNQTVTQASGTDLSVNRFENAKFSDQFGSVGAAAADCSGPCVVYVTASDTECNSTIPANVTVIGYGVSATTISCATTSQPVFNVTGSGVEIYDLTIKHVTSSPISGGDGIVTCNGCDRIKIQNVRTSFNYNGLKLGYASYAELNNIISERNNNDGVLFVTDGTAGHQPQWEVRGGISQQNGGAGFEYTNSTNSLQTTCPHFSGWTATFGNQGPGFLLQATGTSAGIADCLFDGILASQNNDSGIRVNPGTAGARNIIISNVYAEQAGTFAGTQGFSGSSAAATNVGYGVEVLGGTNDSAPNISNLTLWDNSFSGLYLGSTGSIASNIQCFKNGVAGSVNAYQRACTTIRATNVQVRGLYSKDSGSNMTNGVEISNSADTPSVSNNVCDSSVASCLTVTTQPSHGFLTDLTAPGAPSGACTNGTLYRRSDATGGIYLCVNAAWSQITVP